MNETKKELAVTKDDAMETQKKIEKLKAELEEKQKTIEALHKDIRKIVNDLAKAKISVVVPSEVAINASRNMGPMDDVFFNKIGEDAGAIGEVISTILGIPVIVKEVIPQYTIAGIGNRGVRLDSLSLVVPEVMVAVELKEDCYLGKKGTMVDIEVQKDDKDDHEYRVYYNGASIVVNNTPRGTERFADIQRAVVIFISDFDVFGEGEMYYEVRKYIEKSKTPRRSPVTEIYVNTAYDDRSDERMKNISDLMKAFKNPDFYDFNKFPNFSQRKKDLKETQEGVITMSQELQQIIDMQREEAARLGRAEGERLGRAEGRAEERKDLTGLMSFLVSNGRSQDLIKAANDESFLNRLLADFHGGLMATT